MPKIDDVIPFYGNGDELNLAFNIPFVQLPLRGTRAAGRDRADRGADARGLHAGVDREQPRRAPLPDPVGRERPGTRPVRADDADDPAREACSCTRATRSAWSTRRSSEEQMKDPGLDPVLPGVRARRRPHADAVDERARRRLHRTGRRAVAAVRRPVGQRRGPAPRSGVVPVTVSRSHRRTRRAAGSARRRVRVARRAGRGARLPPRRADRRRAQPRDRRRRASTGSPEPSASRHAAATRRANASTAR